MSDWILWPLAALALLAALVVVAVWLFDLLRGGWPTPTATRWVCGCHESFASLADLKAHMALVCPNRRRDTFPTREAAQAAYPKEELDA